MRKLLVTSVSIGAAFLMSGCTEQADTTSVAAATGGVIGAGVGAIIGNQTGSTAGGLLIGSVAGAGTGALIGDALEGQDKKLQAKDELLSRQERAIQAQRRELEELRRETGDGAAAVQKKSSARSEVPRDPDHARLAAAYAKARPVRGYAGSAPQSLDQSQGYVRRVPSKSSAAAIPGRIETRRRALAPAKPQVVMRAPPRSVGAIEHPAPARGAQGMLERDLGAGTETELLTEEIKDPTAISGSRGSEDSVKGAYDWSRSDEAEKKIESEASADECETARKEVTQGDGASDTADKLFHFRRALRLCPLNADYHVKLGEVYQSLKRSNDAAFEYQEALRLNPQHNLARTNLAALGR